MAGETKNIITVGSSAGGISACAHLLSTLKQSLDAAVFIVLHMSRVSRTEVILAQLQKSTPIPCRIPDDMDLIESNTVYLAPNDHHIMIDKAHILVRKGAYENLYRPSIDVLFRSAAAAYGECVTGIILSGLLDDGTSGMNAIKRSGGKCIIQDPEEAEFPDMPKYVFKNVDVDFMVPISDMGYILSDLFARGECNLNTAPEDVNLETELALRMSSEVSELQRLGSISPFSCPDCGGVLVKIANDSISRYRCYTGHSYTEELLENEQ